MGWGGERIIDGHVIKGGSVRLENAWLGRWKLPAEKMADALLPILGNMSCRLKSDKTDSYKTPIRVRQVPVDRLILHHCWGLGGTSLAVSAEAAG